MLERCTDFPDRCGAATPQRLSFHSAWQDGWCPVRDLPFVLFLFCRQQCCCQTDPGSQTDKECLDRYECKKYPWPKKKKPVSNAVKHWKHWLFFMEYLSHADQCTMSWRHGALFFALTRRDREQKGQLQVRLSNRIILLVSAFCLSGMVIAGF